MDGSQTGWAGRTFAVRIDPIAIYPLAPGYACRVTVLGSFLLDSLYIGPVSARDPWIAAALYRMTFNGGDKSVIAYTDDFGNYVPVQTDTYPLDFDGSRGLIVTGYLDPGGNEVVLTQSDQLGWSSRYIQGDDAANVIKNIGYTDSTMQYASIAVQLVESYYTPPASGVSTVLR